MILDHANDDVNNDILECTMDNSIHQIEVLGQNQVIELPTLRPWSTPAFEKALLNDALPVADTGSDGGHGNNSAS